MNSKTLSKGELRRRQIVNLLKSQGRVTLQELVDRFQCSEATARRDLDSLEKSGLIIRTIGGALYEGGTNFREVSFHEKQQHLWLQKEAIASKAAALVQEGDVIGLTGGTTTYLIAKALKARSGITVVTNAVNIAAELAEADDIQVVVIGGVMRSKSFELCGPLAEQSLAQVHIGKMFLGIDGISEQHGLTTYSELEARIAQLFIERANQSIVVFDHTKVNKTSLFQMAPISKVDACITDAEVKGPLLDCLKQSNVKLYRAEVQGS